MSRRSRSTNSSQRIVRNSGDVKGPSEVPGICKIWIRSVGGERVRADSLVALRCCAGEVDGLRAGGWIRLAGPGCLPAIDTRLAAEITDLNETLASRLLVIVSEDLTSGRPAWTRTSALDLAAAELTD